MKGLECTALQLTAGESCVGVQAVKACGDVETTAPIAGGFAKRSDND